MYGRDPRLPELDVLSQLPSLYFVDCDDYREELTIGLTSALGQQQRNALKEGRAEEIL